MNTLLEARQIPSWPKFHWSLTGEMRNMPVFSHVATRLRGDQIPAKNSLYEGETVWSAFIGDDRLVLAWDWMELRPGVVMARDPNTIVTNICFVNSTQQEESELDAIISANRLLHLINWQEVVAGIVTNSRLERP